MTATLFAKDGGEYVRVSTNAPKPDGSGRAVGTVLAGPALEAIKAGKRLLRRGAYTGYALHNRIRTDQGQYGRRNRHLLRRLQEVVESHEKSSGNTGRAAVAVEVRVGSKPAILWLAENFCSNPKNRRRRFAGWNDGAGATRTRSRFGVFDTSGNTLA